MISCKHILVASGALLLASCADGQPSDGGHDHAAMQAGQRTEAPAPNFASETSQYTCPMHPHYISTDPDGTCPICGMDLVPVAASGQASGSGVVVSPEMIQTMGVRTTTVRREDWDGNLRAFGRVEPNARLSTTVASRLEGWIEGLTVRAEGDAVRRGQRLYSIYAPDLIAGQKELLASIEIGNERRIASVRQRLKSRGMQQSLIERLSESRELIERVPVYAETAGIVTDITVRDGDYLKPGDPLMTLQSYDTVWVIASVAETDLPKVQLGMPAQLRFDSAPDATGTAVVDYIYPTLERTTRTADIRLTVENAEGLLRPGAYADIIFQLDDETDAGSILTVPTQAVLRDSSGAHVILSTGEGRFESRAVNVGRSEGGRTEILGGLNEGETIVSSGQFMLDSEANLRAGFASLSGRDFTPQTPLSDLPVDAAALGQIDHIVDAGLYFHEALIDGYDIDPYFLDPTIKIVEVLEGRFGRSTLAPILEESQSALEQAQARLTRENLTLSLERLVEALEPWLIEGNPSHYRAKGLNLFREDDTDRLWLQESALPANPYSTSGSQRISWPSPQAETER